MQGKIIKGIAGFYYVYCEEDSQTYECKAKGIFRKNKEKPLVGDDVTIDVIDSSAKTGNITEILPRRNSLIRPAVANIDQALVVFAIKNPEPNLNLLDRFLVMMGANNLEAVICFNKLDMDSEGISAEYKKIYSDAGYKVVITSVLEKTGLDEVRALLSDKTTALAGPSGVGKSSTINSLQTGVFMETGDISEKIDRGKHTTRHSQLIPIDISTYILDTPGFSSLDVFVPKGEDLWKFYPEFVPHEKFCKFTGCSHITEPDCGVKKALNEGKINALRYDNYCKLFAELKKSCGNFR